MFLSRLLLTLFILTTSTLSALSLVPISIPPQQCGVDTYQFPILNVGFAAGKSIGIDKNYATVGLFYSPLPLYSNVLPFVDLRAHRMSNNLWATSVGGGARIWCSDCCSLIGFNGFYDFREAKLGDFHQAGIGFEWLTSTWKFSINGYFPFKNKYVGETVVFDDFIGEFTFSCTPTTFSKKGVDFELGRSCGCYDNFILYLGAGSYYFHGTPGNNYGLKLRSSLAVARYFSIEGIGIYDNSCDLLLQLKISLWLPLDIFCNFCCRGTAPCCDYFYTVQPVNRSDMIFLENQCCGTGNF